LTSRLFWVQNAIIDNRTFCIIYSTDQFAVTYPDNYLYIIGVSGEKVVKIGRAGNVKSRLHDLQISNHKKMVLLGSILCPVCIEGWVHKLLKKVHIRGEWFKRDKVVERLIEIANSGDVNSLYTMMNLPAHTIKTLTLFHPKEMELPNEARL